MERLLVGKTGDTQAGCLNDCSRSLPLCFKAHDNPEIWLPIFRPRRESGGCQGTCDLTTADLVWINGSPIEFEVHNNFHFTAGEMCFTYWPSSAGYGVIRGSHCAGAATARPYICQFSCYAVPLLVLWTKT